MSDLSIYLSSDKSYSYCLVEDMRNLDVPPVSGVTLVMEPTLATAADDVDYFISTEDRVVVSYPWFPAAYWDENEELPEEWENIDLENDGTWPSISNRKYYENGKLIDEWVWSYE